MQPFDQFTKTIIDALAEEKKALASSTPRISILSNGVRVAVKPQRALYRFEIPDNFYFAAGMKVDCTIGTSMQYSFPAVVAEMRSQFLFLTFPCDIGESIPELQCSWDPSEITDILSSRWSSLKPNTILEHLIERSFPDNIQNTTREPIFPSSFTEAQRTALKQSIGRRISVIIGERKRGKTGVAAALLFNALRDGKKILYLASTSESLYDCMKEIISLNPVVAEESIALVDIGLDLQPPLDASYMTSHGIVDAADQEGLHKLFSMVVAEHDYDRVRELQEKIAEKKRQIDEAANELERVKQELAGLQNASMMEKMKRRINKTMIDDADNAVKNASSLLDRLNQQIILLTKEEHKIESSLPVSLKERKEIEKLLAKKISFTSGDVFLAGIKEKKCLATTLSQALLLQPAVVSGFDVVCIDDAHTLNLPEFFYCASLAGDQCYILADVTEQPPQSVSQTELPRLWLQKNYFSYIQQSDADHTRFAASALAADVVSELKLSDETPSIFDASLSSALSGEKLPKGLKGKIFFIDTERSRTTSGQYIGKRKILPFNEVHAQKVTECVKHALMNGATSQSDIIIVTPPSGQSLFLREHLKSIGCGEIEIASFGSIRLTTKRTMIFDLTVAGIDFTLKMLDDRKFGRVEIADSLNTLLSTVSEELYAIADLSYFQTRYKGKLITSLLEMFKSVSESTTVISNDARRFDEESPAFRTLVLHSSREEKQAPDYRTKIQHSRPSALNASQSMSQETVAAAEKKLSNEIRSVVRRVLAKRESVNLIAQYLESYPLYRSTAETQQCYTVLPDQVCENENDFKTVMDMWNLLIYETSDAHTSKHPLAEKARVDAKISSDLRQIHSYYHSELEMVVEEGKHKLAQSIQKVFNDCIGKKPVTPADWKNAYLIFLSRMEKYLDTVIQQIRL